MRHNRRQAYSNRPRTQQGHRRSTASSYSRYSNRYQNRQLPRSRTRMQAQRPNNRKLFILLIAFIALVCIVIFGISRCVSKSLHAGEGEVSQQLENQNYEHLSYQTSYELIDSETFDFERAKLGGSTNPQKDLHFVLSNTSVYPAEVLNNLSLNPEMLKYAADYPQDNHAEPAKTIGKAEIVNHKIPHLLQFDQRWGYEKYGDYDLAISGCGPTVLSMVYAGLTGKKDKTPYDMAQFAEENGWYSADGTSWELMSAGVEKLGLQSKQLNQINEKVLIQELKAGHPVIASMKPGDFTILGHFIVLTGITSDGLLIVNDPNSITRTNTLWTFDRVIPQIKIAWSISK
ncbi:MAG: papain-like cysteine protease family protein [Coriobacteriia bacterium]|nr:papain-like cysteine protease family protein [Coriobacteriia bacterium]